MAMDLLPITTFDECNYSSVNLHYEEVSPDVETTTVVGDNVVELTSVDWAFQEVLLTAELSSPFQNLRPEGEIEQSDASTKECLMWAAPTDIHTEEAILISSEPSSNKTEQELVLNLVTPVLEPSLEIADPLVLQDTATTVSDNESNFQQDLNLAATCEIESIPNLNRTRSKSKVKKNSPKQSISSKKKPVKNKQKSVIQCPTCNKTFKRNSTLKRHQITHSDDPKPFTCDICQNKFTQSTTLSVHKKEVHSGAKTYIHCEYCSRKFSRHSDYVRHVKSHLKPISSPESTKENNNHNKKKGGPNFGCLLCNKKFQYKHDLKRHQTVHSGEKKHQCPHCPKIFRLPYNLKEHIESHFHQKNYKSKYCGLSFRQWVTLRNHEKLHEEKGICKHHPRVGVRCEDCNEKFPTKFLLEQHKKLEHHHAETFALDSQLK